MSWGERSCTLYGSCPHKPEISTCNVNCPHYGWNGRTKPDSEKTKIPLVRAMQDLDSTSIKRGDKP